MSEFGKRRRGGKKTLDLWDLLLLVKDDYS